jgi:hypothetical protein
VSGLDVHALSSDEGTGTHTVQTAGDGSYRIKMHAGFDYDVWIDTAPWVTQYFDDEPDASTATPVNPAPSSIGIDFVMQTPPPDLSGTFVDSATDPVEVETYLFKYDVDDDAFEPYASTPLDDTINFSDLAYGDYRLGFWDTTANEWMPWEMGHYTDLFLDTVITPVRGEECYLSLDVDPGYGDITFDAQLHPGDYGQGSCKSPAIDGGDRGTFSGQIIDYDADSMGGVLASLYLENGSGPEWEGTVTVDEDGYYAIQGVDEDGVYYVRFSAPDDKPWLDTWLGGIWTGAPGADVDAYNAGVTLTAYRDSSGHDVELLPATVFSGTLTSDGDPLPYVQVDVWDPFGDSWFAVTELVGTYTVKVPIGGDYYVAVLNDWYYEQYWENAPDDSSATVFDNSVQEVNTGIDFDMVILPEVIHGQLWEPVGPGSISPINDIWVHLYELQGYSWVEVQSQPTSGSGLYYFEVEGITDYKIRFTDGSGNWLGLTESLTGDSSSGGGPFVPGSTCTLEFPSVEPGDNLFGDGVLDTTDFTTCGPETSVISGRLVETQALSHGAPITNQYVELSDDPCGCGTTYSTFTDPDGYFSFVGLPDNTYYLYVPTSEHMTGTGAHSYTEYSDSLATVGSAYFGEIELTRYGNVYGSIDNWDPSMTGATVLVIFDEGGGSWTPSSYVEVEVDSSTGEFEVPGVDVDGTYTVAFFMPDEAPYLDSVLGGQLLGPAIDFDTVETFTVVAEEDYHSVSMTIPAAQLIQGVVSYQPPAPDPLVLVEGAAVLAFSEDYTYAAMAETDVNGEYTLKVAPGLSYEVFVSAGSPYLDQYWDGHIGCGCDYDPVTVGAISDPPTTGIDFHLLTEDDVVTFDVYTSLFDGNDFEDVTVHLYQQVAGVWTEVATSDTDSDGLTLLYGLEDNDYRVKFSDGTTWLPIVDVQDANAPGALPLGSQCYYDFEGAELGDEYVYDFHLNEGATVGVCGNASAPSGGGGSSGGHHSGGSDTESTSTPTPTPTPTATTEPDDDGDGGSVPGRSTDDATDEPTTPPADFPWGGWLIVVVVVIAVCGVGFVILRRR